MRKGKMEKDEFIRGLIHSQLIVHETRIVTVWGDTGMRHGRLKWQTESQLAELRSYYSILDTDQNCLNLKG